MIHIEEDGPCFHLAAGDCSYIATVLEGELVHAYWGGRLEKADRRQLVILGTPHYTVTAPLEDGAADEHFRYWYPPPGSLADEQASAPEASFSPELLPLEYPAAGGGDLREPALRVRFEGGGECVRLKFRDAGVIRGHQGIQGPRGLPYVSAPPMDCETLRITLADEPAGLRADLHYLPIPDLPVILRWVRVTNEARRDVLIEHAASASLDLFMEEPDMVTLDGAWARERHITRCRVCPGRRSVKSRGGVSSHQHAPFAALVEAGTGEMNGVAAGATLLYSGNHRHLAEGNQFGFQRLQCGINPEGFAWRLGAGESFDTPAAALAWSNRGLTGMSDAYHGFLRRYIFPEQWRERDRPIVINTWEAHYFDVNHDKVVELARRGKEIGGEVLVVDDGWFTNRRDDRRALGDWKPDEGKFPGGLEAAAAKVREAGLDFGIWVEPEMVNPESELYRRHPEWVLGRGRCGGDGAGGGIGGEGREPLLSRNQLVLNLALPEVVDYLLELFSDLFASAPIGYVKWDMNRAIVETDRPDTAHRYMLGLYRLISTLTRRFPRILFEGCAGGGGRFDFGFLAYMPQFWTSDQTDAVERLRIQFGSSLLFPPETMGAHVTGVPNHQVGRITPASTRALTALCFNFGFELDFSSESPESLKVYTRACTLYKRCRRIFRTGHFLRLRPPQHRFAAESRHSRDDHAWAVKAADGSCILVFYFQVLPEPNHHGHRLCIPGLDRTAIYRDKERKSDFEGAFLMNRGLWIPPGTRDFRAVYWILEKRSLKKGLFEKDLQ